MEVKIIKNSKNFIKAIFLIILIIIISTSIDYILNINVPIEIIVAIITIIGIYYNNIVNEDLQRELQKGLNDNTEKIEKMTMYNSSITQERIRWLNECKGLASKIISEQQVQVEGDTTARNETMKKLVEYGNKLILNLNPIKDREYMDIINTFIVEALAGLNSSNFSKEYVEAKDNMSLHSKIHFKIEWERIKREAEGKLDFSDEEIKSKKEEIIKFYKDNKIETFL